MQIISKSSRRPLTKWSWVFSSLSTPCLCQVSLPGCACHLRNISSGSQNTKTILCLAEGTCSGFPAAVRFFGSQHARIPPAAHTYQSDVEIVHRLIEDEFYDLETFRSRAESLAKATVYQLYFNLVRPNSHKGDLSPWQIIQQLAPRLPLNLCLLPPLFLDYRLNPQGDTIYALPHCAKMVLFRPP